MQPIITRCKVGTVRATSVCGFKRVCAEVGEVEKANYSARMCAPPVWAPTTAFLCSLFHSAFANVLPRAVCIFFFHLFFVCFSAQIMPARSQFRLCFHRSCIHVNFLDLFGLLSTSNVCPLSPQFFCQLSFLSFFFLPVNDGCNSIHTENESLLIPLTLKAGHCDAWRQASGGLCVFLSH